MENLVPPSMKRGVQSQMVGRSAHGPALYGAANRQVAWPAQKRQKLYDYEEPKPRSNYTLPAPYLDAPSVGNARPRSQAFSTERQIQSSVGRQNVAPAMLSNARQQCSDIEERLLRQQEFITELQRELDAARASRLSVDSTQLQGRVNDLMRELSAARSELAQRDLQILQMNQQGNPGSQKPTNPYSKAFVDELIAENKQLTACFQEQKEIQRQYENQIEYIQQRITDERKVGQTTAQEIASLRQQLKAKQTEIDMLKSSAEARRAEALRAQEEARHREIQSTDYLEQLKAARLEITDLCRKCDQQQALANTAQLQASNANELVKQLQGELQAARQTSSSLSGLQTGLRQAQDEKDQLQDQLEVLKGHLQDYKLTIQAKERELTNLRAELRHRELEASMARGSSSAVENAAEENASLKVKLSQAEREITRLKQELQTTASREDEVISLHRQVLQGQSELQELQRQLAQTQSAKAREVEALRQQHELQKRQQVDRQTEECLSLQNLAQEASKRAEAATDEAATWRERCSRAESELRQRLQDSTGAQSTIANLRERLREQEADIQDLKSSHGRNEALERVRDMQAQIDALTQELIAARESFGSQGSESGRTEALARQLRQLRQIQQQEHALYQQALAENAELKEKLQNARL